VTSSPDSSVPDPALPLDIPAVKGGRRAKTKPFPAWPQADENDVVALTAVLQSGIWSRDLDGLRGVALRAETFAGLLEADVRDRLRCRFALAVSSGTAALDLAARALDLGPGDEVLVPAYTFVASATCVLRRGAEPVFVDVEPGTLNLDVERAERAVTERTRAIVVVHFAGRPADMDAVLELARRRDLRVIEDAAQALGASWRGTPVGTLGDVGCFSLESSKNVTCGEGGLVVSNDESLYRRMCSLHTHGVDWERGRYHHDEIGWNHRLGELQASLAVSQLRRFDEQSQRRARNTALLRRLLGEVEGLVVPESDPSVTVDAHHLFVFRLIPEAWEPLKRRRFVLALNAEGVPCSEGYPWPLFRNPLFERAPATFRAEDCPIAERATRETVWLPHHLFLGDDQDMEEIHCAVIKIHTHRGAVQGGVRR
jgi:dTDP-4-amino-4,6-dideoxygalactose transaminase